MSISLTCILLRW